MDNKTELQYKITKLQKHEALKHLEKIFFIGKSKKLTRLPRKLKKKLSKKVSIVKITYTIPTHLTDITVNTVFSPPE